VHQQLLHFRPVDAVGLHAQAKLHRSDQLAVAQRHQHDTAAFDHAVAYGLPVQPGLVRAQRRQEAERCAVLDGVDQQFGQLRKIRVEGARIEDADLGHGMGRQWKR
jgi:hypothetical protein